jgi:hypothetical protein
MLTVLLVEPALMSIVGVGVVGVGVIGADFFHLVGEGLIPIGRDDNGGMPPN